MDATGLAKKEWHPLIRELDKWVFIGGTPCNNEGHTMRLKSGHCLECETSSPAFLLRRLKHKNVFIAGTKSGKILKLGTSKNYLQNIDTLNLYNYAGFKDWEPIIAFELDDTVQCQYKVERKIRRYFFSKLVQQNGREFHCVDLIKCKYTRVKTALSESLGAKHSLITCNNALEEFFEHIEEDVHREEKKTEFVYLDTETTGLDPFSDKIVEISIIDDQGEVLLNTLINPEINIPLQATDVHGITDAMVQNSPTLPEVLPQINKSIRDKKLVIFNYSYDTKFFSDRLGQASEICCALRAYQAYTKKTKGTRLVDAVNHIGYTWEGEAHRALADTKACRRVWHWLLSKDSNIEYEHSYI